MAHPDKGEVSPTLAVMMNLAIVANLVILANSVIVPEIGVIVCGGAAGQLEFQRGYRPDLTSAAFAETRA